MADRSAIPERLKREVLVEAGHRCGICREPSYDIAHIEPWSKVKAHTFDNLIALCPNCHRRADRGEIDRQSLRMYKANLSILSGRYNDFERRLLSLFADQPGADKIRLPAAEFHLLYLLKDGLLRDGGTGGTSQRMGGIETAPRIYILTPRGRAFVNRWVRGEDLGPPPDEPSN